MKNEPDIPMQKASFKDSKSWRALYVKSRAEKKVREELAQKGIGVYLPLVKTLRQWSDRKTWVEIPLINGYIFVCIHPSENTIVLQPNGVVNFVRSEGKIALIQEYEIERLKQLISLGYQLEAGGLKRNYKQGDKIKITSGALKDLEGYVLKIKNVKYLEVLLEGIGQCIKVKLPKELVLPINK